jgi:hypothetical protein
MAIPFDATMRRIQVNDGKGQQCISTADLIGEVGPGTKQRQNE